MQYDEAAIQSIQDQAAERIVEILDALDVDYTEGREYFHAPCPVHQGDNPRAWYWALCTMHWRCKTQHCEQNPATGPSSSVFGLVRGVLAHRIGRECSFRQAVDFVVATLGLGQVPVDAGGEQNHEIARILREYRRRQRESCTKAGVLLSAVASDMPADTTYYPSRGVPAEIIARYHISYCGKRGKPFSGRAFFPILDESGKYVVGYSSRSIYKQCKLCRYYHPPGSACPNSGRVGLYAKWRHSRSFQAERHLYNIWSARPFIAKTGVAVVCEGPGDVWAYEQAGIRNSVAMFGVSLSSAQRRMLQRAGALTLVFTLDNDEAGRGARKSLEEQLQHCFRLVFVEPRGKHDIGEMSADEIRAYLLPILDGMSREKQLAQEGGRCGSKTASA